MPRQHRSNTAFYTIAACYAALALLIVAAFFIGNLRLGTLATIPLLFLAYHTKRWLALLTAAGAGLTLDYADRIVPPLVRIPMALDGVLLATTLCIVVMLAESLRRRSLDLQTRLERAEDAAVHDALTALPNRRAFENRLRGAIMEERKKQCKLAVLFADLDGFKAINDAHGHSVGDAILFASAARLKHVMRRTDFVARLGGDEFGIIVTHISARNDVEHIVANIIEAFEAPITFKFRHFNLGISIGVAIYPDDEESASALLEHADNDMYATKRSKKPLATRATLASVTPRRIVKHRIRRTSR